MCLDRGRAIGGQQPEPGGRQPRSRDGGKLTFVDGEGVPGHKTESFSGLNWAVVNGRKPFSRSYKAHNKYPKTFVLSSADHLTQHVNDN